MNDLNLSTSTKRLVEAAKADVPSSAVRAKVWAGVSGMVGGAAAAGASGAAASAVLGGGVGTTKVLALGGLFGGAITVGLATAFLQIGTATPPADTRFQAVAGAARPTQAVARGVVETPTMVPVIEMAPVVDRVEASPSPSSEAAGVAAIHTHVPSPHRHSKPPNREDSLAREASLVAQARAALSLGDPQSALRAIREARALPSKQLVPEELAVEEQTLRALGRNDEANGINVMLRLQYPESALAP